GRGYPETDVAAVCERGGITEAEFLAHFDDLEDAACRGIEQIEAEIVQRVEAAVARQGSWRLQLRAAAYALPHYLIEDLLRARFLRVDAGLIGERAHLIRHDALQLAIDLIDQGREELADPSTMSRGDAERAAFELFGAVREATLEAEGGDPEKGDP